MDLGLCRIFFFCYERCDWLVGVLAGLTDYGESTGRTQGTGPRATLIVCPLSVLSTWLVCVASTTCSFNSCLQLLYLMLVLANVHLILVDLGSVFLVVKV